MSEAFESIMTGLNEALDYVKGDTSKGRSQKVTVQPVPEFDAQSIKAIRKDLGMTQVVFASVIGVSKKTVEAWECGTNSPSGSSRRLLETFHKNPSLAQQLVKFE